MKLYISPSDVSFVALQGGDIHRFCGHLQAVEIPEFDQVNLFTCWGMLIAQFHGPDGQVTNALNIALLDVTKDIVVSDDGKLVDRYERVVEELVQRAVAKLKLPAEHRELKRDAILTSVKTQD